MVAVCKDLSGEGCGGLPGLSPPPAPNWCGLLLPGRGWVHQAALDAHQEQRGIVMEFVRFRSTQDEPFPAAPVACLTVLRHCAETIIKLEGCNGVLFGVFFLVAVRKDIVGSSYFPRAVTLPWEVSGKIRGSSYFPLTQNPHLKL